MSIETEENLIKKFLDEIELKLPFWLKYNEEELKNVLDELREHIEDKAEALEAAGETRVEAVRAAIFQMGDPATIVREYKRRGTPKFYITEELFPLYLDVMRYAGYAVGAIFAIIAIVGTLLTAFTGGAWVNYFFGVIPSFLMWTVIVAAGITVVFAWFSYEGFFPEDLKEMMKPKEKRKTGSRAPPKTRVTVAQPAPAMSRSAPLAMEEKPKYPKNLKKPHDLIIGGIFNAVVGIICVAQPFSQLNAMLDPVFLQIMMGVGFFWIILGILSIIHGSMAGWSWEANRGLYPARAVISLAGISMVILLLMNPQAFPIPVWTEETGFQFLSLATEFYWLYYLIGALIIIGIIGTAIHNIYRAATLPEEYFFKA